MLKICVFPFLFHPAPNVDEGSVKAPRHEYGRKILFFFTFTET